MSVNLRRSQSLVRCLHVESKINELGLHMPAPAVPKGSFVNFVQVGNLVFLSGHLPQVWSFLNVDVSLLYVFLDL